MSSKALLTGFSDLLTDKVGGLGLDHGSKSGLGVQRVAETVVL